MTRLFDGPAAAYHDAAYALAVASLCEPGDRRHALSVLFGGGDADEMTAGEEIGLHNFVSSYEYALKQDTPAKRWWDASVSDRAPVYRALRVDPEEFGASYACLPFRYMVVDGRHLIAVAYPCPRVFIPIDADQLCIEDVLLWSPTDDTVEFMGQSEGESRLVGNLDSPTRNTLSQAAPALFARPRMFFQNWAQARAQWLALRQQTMRDKWHVTPSEGDEAPGSLIVGDLARIRFGTADLPDNFDCVGIDAQSVNRAILRGARLPRANGGIRAVA